MIDRRTGNTVGDELVRHNCALVKYVPQGVDIEELASPAAGLVDDPRLRPHRLP